MEGRKAKIMGESKAGGRWKERGDVREGAWPELTRG